MRMNDTDRLKVGIDDRRADKAHAASFEIARQAVRQRRSRFVVFIHRFAVREGVKIGGKAAVFFCYLHKHSGIADGGDKLSATTDDGGVLHQCVDLFGGECRDGFGVESLKCLAKCVPLVENGFPRQPRLKSFKDQHLEQIPLLKAGNTPFLVVIAHIPLVFLVAPTAPHNHSPHL